MRGLRIRGKGCEQRCDKRRVGVNSKGSSGAGVKSGGLGKQDVRLVSTSKLLVPLGPARVKVTSSLSVENFSRKVIRSRYCTGMRSPVVLITF